jgi:hypothetical protein
MSEHLDGEPTLESISDYNEEKDPSKRKIFWTIVAVTLVLGVIFSLTRSSNNSVSDYVGTPEKPGINTTKTF